MGLFFNPDPPTAKVRRRQFVRQSRSRSSAGFVFSIPAQNRQEFIRRKSPRDSSAGFVSQTAVTPGSFRKSPETRLNGFVFSNLDPQPQSEASAVRSAES